MAHFVFILLLLALRGTSTSELAAAPTDAATGVVAGTVHAAGQPVPGDMVIYLELADASVSIPLPTQHARVSQKGAQFSPTLTIVAVGQTIDFVNDEDRAVEHNVFSNAPGASFDLVLFPKGEARSASFDKPGPVQLFCSVHKFMDGVVYVCPNRLFSRVDTDGHYRIEAVPPGQYTLRTWQRRRRFPEQSIPVKVDPGQSQTTADVELRRK